MITLTTDLIPDNVPFCHNTLDCVKLCFEGTEAVERNGERAVVFIDSDDLDLIRFGSQLCINGTTFTFGKGEPNLIPVTGDPTTQILEIINAVDDNGITSSIQALFFFGTLRFLARDCTTDINLQFKNLSPPAGQSFPNQSRSYFDAGFSVVVKEDYEVRLEIRKDEDDCPSLCYNIPAFVFADCTKCLPETVEVCKEISAGLLSLCEQVELPNLYPNSTQGLRELTNRVCRYLFYYSEYYDGSIREQNVSPFLFIEGCGEYLREWNERYCENNFAETINMYEGVTLCAGEDTYLQFRSHGSLGSDPYLYIIRYRGDQNQILHQEFVNNNNSTDVDFYEVNLNPCLYLANNVEGVRRIDYGLIINGDVYLYNFPVVCCKKATVQILFLTKSKFWKTLTFCFTDEVSTEFFNERIESCECCDGDNRHNDMTRSEFKQTLQLSYLDKKHYNDILLCELFSSDEIFLTKDGAMYPVTIGNTTLAGLVDISTDRFLREQSFGVTLRYNKKI